jgi:hypothetical protein
METEAKMGLVRTLFLTVLVFGTATLGAAWAAETEPAAPQVIRPQPPGVAPPPLPNPTQPYPVPPNPVPDVQATPLPPAVPVPAPNPRRRDDVSPAQAWQSRLGDAAVAYAANQVYRAGDAQMVAREYHVPGRTRSERYLDGMHQIVITLHDEGRSFFLLPEIRRYVEVDLGAGNAGGEGALGGRAPDPRPLGTETISGLSTTKHAFPDPEGGYVWVTREGIVMRLWTPVIGGQPPVDMWLTDVRLGPQDARLFQIPPDFQPLEPNQPPG